MIVGRVEWCVVRVGRRVPSAALAGVEVIHGDGGCEGDESEGREEKPDLEAV